MDNPFETIEETTLVPVEQTDENKYYNEIDATGTITKYKIESGIPVLVETLGNVKDFTHKAIQRIAMMTPNEIDDLALADMSHMELALINMIRRASEGDHKSIQELLDRILGKSKMVSENMNITATLDDVLKNVPRR